MQGSFLVGFSGEDTGFYNSWWTALPGEQHNWTPFWQGTYRIMVGEMLVIVDHIILICFHRFTNNTLFDISNEYF